jgi:hypothetical protein
MSGADRPTLKPRELPDPDERGRVYEAMRAHASAEPAAESSDAAAESQLGQQADGQGRLIVQGFQVREEIIVVLEPPDASRGKVRVSFAAALVCRV